MNLNTLKALITNATLVLVLSSCGGDADGNKDLADTRVYKQNSPYSSVIASCARADENSGLCSLNTLPVLGMDFNDPGIPQIMDRVVVSHDWMGERFEELLYEMPSQMLTLFKGVTAIVIDADIRPAYYTASTGAIYLDPAFLWLSVEEKRTINPKADYRAGFDDPLAFRHLQRYVKNGQQAYQWASLTDNTVREMDDIVLLAARLLFHELAHANDFIPPDSYDNLDSSSTVADTVSNTSEHWLSSRLTDQAPLSSEIMFSLSKVMYAGATPSIDDLEVTAGEAGNAFRPDGAGDDYGYTSQFEDLAMLFETSMMKYFFDADYELAFTSVPENSNFCDDYLIGWGVRNRLGDPTVKPRALFTVQQMLPNEDFNTFFETLDPPTEISGDWCISANPQFEQQKPQRYSVDPLDMIRPYL